MSERGAARCDAVRNWLARRPLRDNPRMAGAVGDQPWGQWVDEGRANADTEACLLEFLDTDTDAVTRSDVAMALGYVGSRTSVPRLLALLTGAATPAPVAMEAAAALGRLGDPQAVPALIAASKSGNANVRANAYQALGALGGSEALAALEDGRRDADSFVRKVAEDALSRARR